MKENDQSRFIRWGIPGWMMFISFISFLLFDITLSPVSNNNSLVGFLARQAASLSLDSTASAAVVLLVAASGIPLGFLIYQVYFYIRWNSPFSRDGLFPPLIVGRWNDLERTISGIKENDIIGNDAWRKAWASNPLYKTDHSWKWRYIENLFIELAQELDSKFSGASINVRYRYLLDLMHTLGAGLFGIYLGYLAYLLVKVKTDSLSLTILTIISAACLFILVWLLEAEDKVRREENKHENISNNKYLALKPIKNIPAIQFSNPSAIYLIFLFAILYFGSPSPYVVTYTQNHLLFRLIVIALIAGAWVFSKRHYPKAIIWTELITLTALTTVAYLIAQWLKSSVEFKLEWWNIGWSILLFLITNMIFVKNRQNTRDDLIAMQNYTIKRCLSIRNQPKPKGKPAKIK